MTKGHKFTLIDFFSIRWRDMSKCKVGFITHQLAKNVKGGAETQLLKTRDYLNKKIEVNLFDMWHDDIEDYDIIHIFNPHLMPVEACDISKKCKSKNIKIVVSPIFWLSPKINPNFNPVIIRLYIKFIQNSIFNKLLSSLGSYNYLKMLFELSDIILPNTNAEMKLLKNFYKISHNNFSVIPNGVDLTFKKGDSKLFEKKFGLKDFVLFSGGIYKRKNVLSLIKAFNKIEINTDLVIIGKVQDDKYFELCKQECGNNIKFLPPLPHNSEMLKSAYKAAKVVVLPSYFETPGLSCLEGGLAGANVAVTEIGGTKEYFGDHAWYLNPENETSIEKAVTSAYNAPKTASLSKHIEKNFTWEKVAEKMLEIYSQL